jgi:hypothetical protein
MKYFLIISAFLSIIIQSCEDEDRNVKSMNFRFFVKNESLRNLTIYFYYPNNDLYKQISISSNDSTIVDEGNISPVGGSTFSLTNSLDSAIILFADGKKLIQTFYERGNNDTINNVLSSMHYKSLTPNESIKNQLFILTENDYLRAK